jgi:hypothetical protein
MEFSGSVIVTGSLFDNAFVSTPIPRSEFQYSWINNTISGSNWESGQNILGYAVSDDGTLLLKRVDTSKASGSINLSFVTQQIVTDGGSFDTDPATITIHDGFSPVTFQLVTSGTPSAGNIRVAEADAGGLEGEAENYRDSLFLAIRNSDLQVSIVKSGNTIINITSNHPGIDFNRAMSTTSSGSAWAPNVTGLSGGGTILSATEEIMEAIIFPSSSNIT